MGEDKRGKFGMGEKGGNGRTKMVKRREEGVKESTKEISSKVRNRKRGRAEGGMINPVHSTGTSSIQ